MKISKGRKQKVTEEMLTLMKCLPDELKSHFNESDGEEMAMLGEMYSIANYFNVGTVKLSRSKIEKDFGKSLHSSKIISLTSQLIDKKLISRVNCGKEGTKYKLLFFNNHQQEETETMEKENMTSNEEKVEKRNLPNENNPSILEMILQEMKEIKTENLSIKEGMTILNRNFKTVMREVITLREVNLQLKEEISMLRNDVVAVDTPKTAGNTPTNEESTSIVQFPTKREEKPSESLKMANSNIEETSIKDEAYSQALKEAFPESMTSREDDSDTNAVITAGNTPNFDDHGSDEQSPIQKVELPSKAITASEATVSSKALSIYGKLKINDKTDKHNETINKNASKTSGNTPTADSNDWVIQMPSKEDEKPSESLTSSEEELSPRRKKARILIRAKYERERKGLPTEDIEREIDKLRKEEEKERKNDSTTSSISSEENTNGSKLPKYGNERITLIYRLSLEELLHEKQLREESNLEEDDVIEERIDVLRKHQVYDKAPSPVEYEYGLPF